MIELSSAVVLLVSSLYGPASTALAQDVINNNNTGPQIETAVTLEQYVQNYFAETPVLAKISKCESNYRQFDDQGNILRGEITTDDVGLMQINEFFHAKIAKDMNLDLHTIDGNLAYAKYLYEKKGTAPRKASEKCWNK